jgi:peptidoglycan/LPS O-acetylase OafA/YrhL
VQEFLLRLLSLGWHKGPLANMSLWTFIPVGIAITLLVSLTIYRYFEKPVTAWLNANAKQRARLAPERVRAPLVRETAAV